VFTTAALYRLQDLIGACKKALESHPRNVKALFRRGKAYNSINKLEEASTDLKLALEQEVHFCFIFPSFTFSKLLEGKGERLQKTEGSE
jgi:hypothetical protein